MPDSDIPASLGSVRELAVLVAAQHQELLTWLQLLDGRLVHLTETNAE